MARPTSVTAWVVPLALAGAVMAVYLHGQMGCSDSRWSLFTAVSLLDRRDADLDEFQPVLVARQFHFTERIGSHVYNRYPFGASILAAPLVVALRPVAAVAFSRPAVRDWLLTEQWRRGCPPAAGLEPVLAAHSWTELIVASLLVTLAVLAVYGMARVDLTVADAAVLAAIVAFATPAWSTASRSLWQHGPSMLMLAVALCAIRREWPLAIAGFALGFAYVCRPTNSIPLAIFSAWVLLARPKQLIGYLAGVTFALAPFFAINRHVYGAWLSPYYHPGYFHGNPFVVEALAGLLVSPGRGLFVYSPVLLAAAAGAAIAVRERRLTRLDAAVLACLALHWVAVAWVNPMWWAGDSYGPRFFADVLPLFAYWLVPFFAWLAAADVRRRAIARGALALTVAWSVFVHAEGALDARATAWNHAPAEVDDNPGRLWEWRDAPFLAGVLQRPRPADTGEALASVTCAAAPGAPGDLVVTANHRNTVTLAWRAAAGAVARYAVQTGTRAGSIDLPPRLTQITTLTVDHVWPGTYFARVVAENACGTSAPSNEVRVVVD